MNAMEFWQFLREEVAAGNGKAPVFLCLDAENWHISASPYPTEKDVSYIAFGSAIPNDSTDTLELYFYGGVDDDGDEDDNKTLSDMVSAIGKELQNRAVRKYALEVFVYPQFYKTYWTASGSSHDWRTEPLDDTQLVDGEYYITLDKRK